MVHHRQHAGDRDELQRVVIKVLDPAHVAREQPPSLSTLSALGWLVSNSFRNRKQTSKTAASAFYRLGADRMPALDPTEWR